ncbi:hypothetical protein BCT11_10945 [Vibrio sp. 10N.222.52.B12]|nr:hypothetical protein BCT11_10945 [Vibrio sp. 10N.222.52.B12]
MSKLAFILLFSIASRELLHKIIEINIGRKFRRNKYEKPVKDGYLTIKNINRLNLLVQYKNIKNSNATAYYFGFIFQC